MFGKLRRLFGGKASLLVPGTEALAEGEARKVDVGDPGAGGTQVILCRVDGVIHALDARCPHEGGRIIPGPLADGRYAVCPLHNYKFDPRDGKSVGVACPPARRYRTREGREGCEVWL